MFDLFKWFRPKPKVQVLDPIERFLWRRGFSKKTSPQGLISFRRGGYTIDSVVWADGEVSIHGWGTGGPHIDLRRGTPEEIFLFLQTKKWLTN